MNNTSNKLSIVEKIGYSFGDLAANLIFQTLITFLAFFYTDIYGLKSEHATLIMLIVGLTAAFLFNPIVGALADRTRTKWGKFRPWILFSAVPFGVMALLAFSTPDFAYKGKVIYAAVVYTLLLLVYASSNLPYSALSGVITGDMAERNSISSYRFVAVNIAQFFVQVFMLPIVLHAGDGNKAAGMESVMTWVAVIGTVLLLITFLTTRERVIPKVEQEATLKEDLGDLVKNKPWIIVLTLTILVFVTLAVKGGSYVYYFNYYVDKASLEEFLTPVLGFFTRIGFNFFSDDLASAGFGLFNAGGIIFSMIGIAISPKFTNRYGKRNVFIITLFIATLFVLLFVLFPATSIGMMYLAQIGHMFFYGITTPILWAMIADVADYSEWKTNRRATGIIFSAMMVGLKAGLAVGGAIVTWILHLYGYITIDAVAEGHIVQPDTVAQGAKMLVSVYPAIPFLIGCGLLFFYEINKKMEDQIESDLASKREN